MFKNLLKRVSCKKHEYVTVTNLCGDLASHFEGARCIKKCTCCGKTIKGKAYDDNCKIVNYC